MRLSGKKIEQINRDLKGKILPVYETTYQLQPIRTPSHIICRGKFVELCPPAVMTEQLRPEEYLKTRFGYFCKILVTWAAKKHRSKVGNEYIFNIANKDIEAILAKKQNLTPISTGL